MNRNNINYLFVGVLVIAMGISLLVVLFQLTGRDERTEPYFALFNNVTNIQEGTSVTYNGFPIGYVSNIEPVRTSGSTQYNVALALKQDWTIPTDSEAKIYAPGMLADTMIDIEEGKLSTYHKPGDTIITRESPELMTLLADTAGEIQNLSTDSIQPLIASLQEIITRVGSNMDDSIRQISQESLVLLKNLDQIGKNMDDNMGHISKGTVTLLSSLDENSQELSRLMDTENAQHFSSILENANNSSKELTTTVRKLSEAGEKLNTLLSESNDLISDNKQDIRSSIEETNNTMQTISSNIESIVFQLDNASRNMNEFSRRIRENPSSLIQGRPLEDNAE